MADEPLYMNAVKQKSFVEVNEEGTEAAAVTTVTLALSAPRKLFGMIVDLPFLFVIAVATTRRNPFCSVGMVFDPAE